MELLVQTCYIEMLNYQIYKTHINFLKNLKSNWQKKFEYSEGHFYNFYNLLYSFNEIDYWICTISKSILGLVTLHPYRTRPPNYLISR